MQTAGSAISPPTEFRLGHRRWLDGLRGVAITLVLMYHCSLWMPCGLLGVDLFFVLSGFLITCLLLEEHSTTGRISLRHFYYRRALRLLPALLLLLTAMGIWVALTRPLEFSWFKREAKMALLFATNMQGRLHSVPMAKLGFAWSLSVEEQFYLVWSFLLLVLLRCRASKPVLAGLITAGIAAVAVSRALRFAAITSPVGEYAWFEVMMRLYTSPETRADAPLCGCLAAVLVSWGVRARTVATRRRLHVAALLLVVFLTACVTGFGTNSERLYYGLFTAYALAAAALIVCTIIAPLPALRRVLEWSPLVGMGRISYGLFLFHLPVAAMMGIDVSRMGVLWPVNTLLVLGTSILAATVSYYAIERPVLRLKDRFTRTAGSPVLPAPMDTAVAEPPPQRMAA